MTFLTPRAAMTIALCTLAACASKSHQRSSTNDIFREDDGDESTGNARRHPATANEKLWTINMGGCTGHLIAPDYMMTANHCGPSSGARYTSGYAQTKGQRGDITVTQVMAVCDTHLTLPTILLV